MELIHFFYNNNVPLEDLGNGLKRKVLVYHENLMVVEVYFEKGAEGEIIHMKRLPISWKANLNSILIVKNKL